MNWKNIWIELFGRTDILNIDMGFWIAMAVVLIIVIVMNIVFWRMKPKISVKKENDPITAEQN